VNGSELETRAGGNTGCGLGVAFTGRPRRIGSTGSAGLTI